MGRRLRILHVVDCLGKGGLENGLVNLTRGLDPERFEHVVCAIRALGDNADRIPKDRARVICLNAAGEKRSRLQIAALARAIRETKPDIAHSRNWPAIEAAIAAACIPRCSVVHSEHGLDAAWVNGEPRRRVCLRRLAFSLADRVVAVSCQLRDLHSRRTGFPASRITVIHNGVDSERFSPDPAARARVRQELGIGDGEFCLGCVGNLFPVKDHRTLLDGAARLASQLHRPWRLLVVGEGPERQSLEAMANSHPMLQGRVRFLGSSSRVPELLQGMDVYVLSSIAEGICNSLLEAMATGLPVVASDAGGNPEVVIDGESGLLFPVGDAGALAQRLHRLAAEPAFRMQIARQALARAREQFSIGSMVGKYERLYESVAPRAAAGAGV